VESRSKIETKPVYLKTMLKLKSLGAVLLTGIAIVTQAQTPIKDVLAQIDPATGTAKDTATEFSVSGIVAARYVAGPDKVVAFLHNAGEPALAVLTDLKSAEKLLPRNVVKLAGKLGGGPFGAALQLNPASVSLVESNKPFKSNPITGAAFKDATAFQGQYVVLNNVTFSTPKFDASGSTKVKTAEGTEVTVLLSQGAANREAPTEATDVFGIVVKAGGEWQLLAGALPAGLPQSESGTGDAENLHRLSQPRHPADRPGVSRRGGQIPQRPGSHQEDDCANGNGRHGQMGHERDDPAQSPGRAGGNEYARPLDSQLPLGCRAGGVNQIMPDSSE
jgi:hypothetical protein